MYGIASVYSHCVFTELLCKILHILHVTNYIVSGFHEKNICIFSHMQFVNYDRLSPLDKVVYLLRSFLIRTLWLGRNSSRRSVLDVSTRS